MIYDAKEKQVCQICGFEIHHNKQGWFTVHLKQMHALSLEDYLLQYFYTKEELQCKNPLCKHLVGLRRGKPKGYCSKSCSMKKNLTCKWCGILFFSNHKGTKTCSPECGEMLRRKSIVEWHAKMSAVEKERHFQNIISKTAKTRRENKTPSWNSGKTGIYSEETIQKIRKATLRQMAEQRIVKTKIEKIMDELLDTLGVEHKYSFILDQHQYDFVLPD